MYIRVFRINITNVAQISISNVHYRYVDEAVSASIGGIKTFDITLLAAAWFIGVAWCGFGKDIDSFVFHQQFFKHRGQNCVAETIDSVMET